MEAVRKAESFLGFPQIEVEVTRKKISPRLWRGRSFSLFFKFSVCASLLSALTILNLSQRALITENALTLDRLKNRLNQEEIVQERLLLKKTSLESPKRIEKIAILKLGMVKPAQVTYMTIPKNIAEDSPLPRQSLAPHLAGKEEPRVR